MSHIRETLFITHGWVERFEKIKKIMFVPLSSHHKICLNAHFSMYGNILNVVLQLSVLLANEREFQCAIAALSINKF